MSHASLMDDSMMPEFPRVQHDSLEIPLQQSINKRLLDRLNDMQARYARLDADVKRLERKVKDLEGRERI